MDIVRREIYDVVVFQVNLLRATFKDADDIKEFLTKDVGRRSKKILVDLSKCEFIDSTFLGILVISLKKVSEYGGRIKLVVGQSSVNSMFELTRINKVFEIFSSAEEALKSFG